jgi:hypothetical protein
MESPCRLSPVVMERGSYAAALMIPIGTCSMKKLEIPHDAFVFVGDGRKALFLGNVGDEVFPNFRAERVCPRALEGAAGPIAALFVCWGMRASVGG